MCDAQVHRGPDSFGSHVEEGIALGMRRLQVIDLQTGDQPIFNEAGDVAVVMNGEIYNFRELRESLRARGHRFATESDTEVIVHLYEEHGDDCVSHLNGMFAFALWDRARRRLLLGRDRLGKKPLLYAAADGRIAFASEFAALLQDRSISREVDSEAIDAYLAYRYVPAPLTAFRAVRKLPPGCTLSFDAAGMRIKRYWQLRFEDRPGPIDEDEVAADIRDLLRAATRRRLISDVPLGAFLSGGIDSAAVVAAMAEASSGPVKTFSIGFESETLNELPLARVVAERFGTEHHELMVEPDAMAILPKLVRHHGEPFADPTTIPTYYLAEMASRHVTVALNGDGGDEAFGGYTRYVAQLASDRLSSLPAAVRRMGPPIASLTPPSGRIDSLRSRVKRAGSTMALSPAERVSRLHDRPAGAAPGELLHRSLRRDRRRREHGKVRPPALGGLGRAVAGRSDARRRQRPLPARRPARQGRHRDDGELPGGPLAVARLRARRVRRLAAGLAQGPGQQQEADLSSRARGLGSRRDPQGAQTWIPATDRRLVQGRPELVVAGGPARSRHPRARVLPTPGRRAHARPTRPGQQRQLAGDLDPADARAVAPRGRRGRLIARARPGKRAGRDGVVMAMRVAYVLYTYPAISQAFILREVRELRRSGFEIEPFSIHAATPEDLLAEADREEARRTTVLFGVPPLRLAAAHLRLLAGSPRRYASALLEAVRRGLGGATSLKEELGYFAYSGWLVRRLARAGTRHAHSHFAGAPVHIARLTAELGNRLLGTSGRWSWSVTVHGPVEFFEASAYRLGDLAGADFIGYVSEYARRQLLPFLDESAWPKLRRIRCGLDAEAFTPQPDSGATGESVRVLSVGRLVGVKSQEVLIRAVAELAARSRPVQVTLVGHGPRREALERLARELEVGEWLDFAGPVGQDEIRDHYRQADIFCLCSNAESLPVVLMEAMASGLPVISTDVGGIAELIDHGENGLLIRPADHLALAEAIGELRDDPERRIGMADRGRERIERDFTIAGGAAALAESLRRV